MAVGRRGASQLLDTATIHSLHMRLGAASQLLDTATDHSFSTRPHLVLHISAQSTPDPTYLPCSLRPA